MYREFSKTNNNVYNMYPELWSVWLCVHIYKLPSCAFTNWLYLTVLNLEPFSELINSQRSLFVANSINPQPTVWLAYNIHIPSWLLIVSFQAKYNL